MHNEQIFRKKPKVVVLTQRNLTNKHCRFMCINFLIFIFFLFFLNKMLQLCVVINDNHNILSVKTLYTHMYISISLYLCLCV